MKTLLVISNISDDAKVIRGSLASAGKESLDVEWVRNLSDGIDRLKRLQVAAVILDLSLPDSHGIETFDRVSMCAPRVPVLVLSSPGDEDSVQKAVQRGAQDYLPRDRLDSYSIPRAVQTVTALRVATDGLFSDRERAEVTLNSIGDAVLSTDLEGKVTYLNPVAERMTGWNRREALGKPLGEVFHVIDKGSREPARNPLEFAVQQGRTVGLTTNSLLVRLDGFESAIEDSAAPIRDGGGRVVGAVIVFRDVGEAQALAAKMSLVAQHDSLTELPNRLLLSDRLSQSIRTARRHHQKLAVLFLDLDHFKTINDSLGHAIGDAVLQSVAKLLRQALRDSDTISRRGGDEFVILLPEIAGANGAALVARKLLATLAAPQIVSGREILVSVSIGISVFPDHGQDAEGLVHSADLAMYKVKQAGGGNYQVFGT